MADTRVWLKAITEDYRPGQIIAVADPHAGSAAADAWPVILPLQDDRSKIDGRAKAYVCVHFSCQPPVNEPQALRALLERP